MGQKRHIGVENRLILLGIIGNKKITTAVFM
jgi:hypothetical protein